MRYAWLYLCFAIVCVTPNPTAFATDVTGTVDLSSVKSAPEPERARAFYWEEPNGALPPRSDSARAHQEVCLVVLGKGQPDSPRYAFEGGDLSPRTMAFRSGSKASLVNTDIFSHQLFSPDLKDLEPLATAPGQLRKVTLGNVGVFALRDQLHPNVTGHAHVIADLLKQVPLKPDGSFSFEMDPGAYTVQVLWGSEVVYEKSVKVSGSKSNLGRIKLKRPKK